MKIKLILILGLLIVGCHQSNVSQSDIQKEKFANLILQKVASQLKRETNLQPIGTIGQMLNQIQVLGLSFYYYKEVDVIEARKLLIHAVNAMMEEINRESRIRPYLSQHPITAWNVEIRIIFLNPDGYDVTPGTLWGVDASEGDLHFKIQDPETKHLIYAYKESYEEALERVADPSLPLVPFEPEKNMSSEDLAKLRKGVSFVSDDGSIWKLDEDWRWSKKNDDSQN